MEKQLSEKGRDSISKLLHRHSANTAFQRDLPRTLSTVIICDYGCVEDCADGSEGCMVIHMFSLPPVLAIGKFQQKNKKIGASSWQGTAHSHNFHYFSRYSTRETFLRIHNSDVEMLGEARTVATMGDSNGILSN